MPRMFRSISPAIILQRTKLASYWNDESDEHIQVRFDMHDTEHNNLIRACTKSTNDKLTKLLLTDMKIVLAFIIGISAFILSWILPLTAIAIAAFSYGAYQLSQRQHASAQFRYSHENLSVCCSWSLGICEKKDEDAMLQNPAIKDMITCLLPTMSPQQMRTIIDNAVEDRAIREAEVEVNHSFESNPRFPYLTVEEQKSLFYKLYGKDQGSFWNIADGLVYALRMSGRIGRLNFEGAQIPALVP